MFVIFLVRRWLFESTGQPDLFQQNSRTKRNQRDAAKLEYEIAK